MGRAAIWMWAGLWIWLALGLSLSGCSKDRQPTTQTGNKLSGKIVLTGSSTVAPLASEMAKRFEALHPGVRVDVQTGGSSRGIADTRQGLADVGMVSRSLKRNETDLMAFPVARDGIGIIVHEDNALSQLNVDQVAAIYTGKVTNWATVGGSNAPITVINKAEGRSTLELFLQHFRLKNSEIRAHVVIGDNEQGVKTVAGNPHAIGYVSIGTAESDAEHGVPIKLLPLDGTEATTNTVADGSYPLSRVLHFVTKEEPTGLSKAFIEYARSSAVHPIIEVQSFVAMAP